MSGCSFIQAAKGGDHVKFRIDRDVLADAVTWVARGLPARPPVPVLAGVLIEADDEGSLTLSAFDYEVSAKVTVPADVAEAGRVLVLGRLLADISRNLPNKPIDVVADGNKVQVTCGSSRFSLLMMPVDDYPTLPSAPESTGTIQGDVFTQAVAQVAIAADRGDTLPILTGVRMEIEGDKITLLATDRYRLAMRELTWKPTASDIAQVALIPARTLSDTAKALGASGSVDMALGWRGRRRRTWSGSRPVSGVRRPGSWTASTPRSPRSSPPASTSESVIETAALVEAVLPRLPGRGAQHSSPPEVHRRSGRHRGRHRRRRPGLRGGRGDAHRSSRHRGSPSTRISCSTGWAPSARPTRDCRSPNRAGPRSSPVRPRRRATPTTATATSSCRCVSPAEPEALAPFRMRAVAVA